MESSRGKVNFEALEGVIGELNDPLTDFFVENNERLLEKYKLKLRGKSYSEKIEKLEFEEIERTEIIRKILNVRFDESGEVLKNIINGTFKEFFDRRFERHMGVTLSTDPTAHVTEETLKYLISGKDICFGEYLVPEKITRPKQAIEMFLKWYFEED